MQDPLSGEVIDPFKGREAIKKRILRAVSPKRLPKTACGFCGPRNSLRVFSLKLNPQPLCWPVSVDLSDLPPERVWGEVEKLLLLPRRPSLGLQWLRELGAIEQLFPS